MKNYFLLFACTLIMNMTLCQVKIGAAGAPASSAIPDLESTTRGLLAPRLTMAQRNAIVSPAMGLLHRNQTISQFKNIYMKMYKLIPLSLIAILANVMANAQSNDTPRNENERFSTQLKNGTVPGLKFAPVTTTLFQTKKDGITGPVKNKPVLVSDKKVDIEEADKVKQVIQTRMDTNRR